MNKPSMPRREFIRSCLRHAVLLLGAAAAARLWRRADGARPDQICRNRGICAGCGSYPGCGLPAALSRRRTQEGPA